MFLKLSKFFTYATLLSVVIVLPSTFFPFIGGKDYFFRTAVELALTFFILWWAFEAKRGEAAQFLRRSTSQPVFIAVSVFVLAFLLASIFADNSQAAFWSNYERGEGGFQMLHYYLFFTLLLTLFTKWKDWRRAFIVSLTAALLMIGYGFLGALSLAYPGLFCLDLKAASGGARQLCMNFITPFSGGGKVPDTLWGILGGSARFQGSLGNPAYVAPYLFFSLFYTFYLWLQPKRLLKKIWLRHSIYAGLAVIFLAFFIFSQTRGAFLGLGAAVIAFLSYPIFAEKKLRTKLVGVLLAVLVLGGGAYTFRNTPFIKRLPGSRLLNISLKEDTVQTRLWTWGSAIKGFKEKPLLGWGPENFATVFDKYFDSRHYKPGVQSETWFDRAHSVFFDYLAETGIIGLISYLAIFGVFYWQFFERQRKGAYKRSEHAGRSPYIQALLFSIPIGYLVQGLALFDVLPIYINIFLFFAFASFFFTNPPLQRGHDSESI